MEHKLELGARDARGILEPEYGQKTGEPRLEGQPVAIIVTHGMGQQVPYETIEDVAQAVQRGVGDPTNNVTSPRSLIRRVRLGTQGKDEVETELVRAEIQIQHKERTFDVHIYEAYWAPLTEGKVTLKDVMFFLFDAAWHGIVNTDAEKGYQRWMFKRLYSFDLPRIQLMLTLALLVLLLVALVLMNGVVVAAAASHAIGGSNSFPSDSLITPLTADFMVADIAAVLIFLATAMLRRWPSWIGWTLIGLAAVMILLAGFFMPLQLAGFTPEKWIRLWPEGWADRLKSIPRWGDVFLTVLWGGEWVAAYTVRWFLIEYVGDVTAYIAAHTVSKFYDLRQQIWQTAMKVARAVYRAQAGREPGSELPKFLYNKIIMVGHSLGSVIAYDVLNGLLLEEELSDHALQVADRTRMFLTFGSPLDKTDFLFRTQADMCSSVREVAAAAVQPMIQSYKNRPQEWVNLYSRSDIISGNLDYYDPPNKDNARDKTLFRNPDTAPVADSRAVKNLRDPDARTPLAAHVEYWTGELLAKTLVHAITT